MWKFNHTQKNKIRIKKATMRQNMILEISIVGSCVLTGIIVSISLAHKKFNNRIDLLEKQFSFLEENIIKK